MLISIMLSRTRQLPTGRRNSTNKPRVKYNMAKPKQTIVTYHTLNHDEAKVKIEAYINKYPGARTSKIIDSLSINPEQVVDILEELETERLVYSRDIGQGPK
jgi:hypothetical protein